MKLKQAVILAGGRGKRLRPITDKIPKPMAPINDIPFLDLLVNSILEVNILNILILVGYKGEIIYNRYKNIRDVNIEFSFGKDEDRTGRRLLNAYDMLDEKFLLLYGDNYWPIELESMCHNFEEKKAFVSTTVFSNKLGTGEYGYENNILLRKDGLVINYDKNRKSKNANGVDIGYFIVSKRILDEKQSGNISFEIDILPKLITEKQLWAYTTEKQYYYITNKQSLKDFEAAVLSNNFKPIPRKYFSKYD